MITRKRTAEELSNEWSHRRTQFYRKVGVMFRVQMIDTGREQLNEDYFWCGLTFFSGALSCLPTTCSLFARDIESLK